MFVTSHPRDEPQLEPAQQTRAPQHSSLKHPEDSPSQSGSSDIFHNTATQFPELRASSE